MRKGSENDKKKKKKKTYSEKIFKTLLIWVEEGLFEFAKELLIGSNIFDNERFKYPLSKWWTLFFKISHSLELYNFCFVFDFEKEKKKKKKKKKK